MNPINFDSKQCERIRRQLDAYLSNELLVETSAEVSRHLESCEACSRELDTRTRVRTALRKAVAKQLPPESLSEAIRTRLRKTQSPFFIFWHAAPRWAVTLAALAFLVLAGAVGQQLLKLRNGRQLVASILRLGVSDHLECAIKGHNYPEVAASPDQLRQKLGPQYAGLLPVVAEKLPGFQILEAHVCSIPGSPRKYIHFIARGQGTIVSIILTKREGESLPAGRLLAAKASDGVDLFKARLEGMSAAGFESNGYFGFVVSDLSEDEMLQLATVLAPPLRNALDAIAQNIVQGAEQTSLRCFLFLINPSSSSWRSMPRS